MGAVRIYKEPEHTTLDIGRWQARSNGCSNRNAKDCWWGETHQGYCNGYSSFDLLLHHLNDPLEELGAYLKK